MTVIETPRLRLRTWRDSDLEPFAAMNADPEVMRFFPSLGDRAGSLAIIERQISSWDSEGFCLWAVEEKTDDTFVGFTGLARPRFESWFTPCVEIGWRLVSRVWGRGYAPEAARAALDYGFQTVGLAEIFSFTATLNLPSRRVMEKLGMTYRGGFEHPAIAEGHPIRPHVLFLALPGPSYAGA